jgi:hypothetical protein
MAPSPTLSATLISRAPDQVPPRLPATRCLGPILPPQLPHPDAYPPYDSLTTKEHIATLSSTPRRFSSPEDFVELAIDNDGESDPEAMAVSQPRYLIETPNFRAVIDAAIAEAAKDNTLGHAVLGHPFPPRSTPSTLRRSPRLRLHSHYGGLAG